MEFPQLHCCAAACSRLLRTTEASLVLRTYFRTPTSTILETFIAGEHSYKQEYQNQPCQTGQAAYSVLLRTSPWGAWHDSCCKHLPRVVESLSASRLLVFRFISWRSYLRPFKAVWSITATALVGQSSLLITCRVARNPPLCPSLPLSCIVSSDRQRISRKDFMKIILVSQDLAFYRY
jgi:hypothetical protein